MSLNHYEHTQTTVYTFNSLCDIADFLKNTPQCLGAGTTSTKGASKQWDLNMGYDGAVNTAANGGAWAEGAEKLAALIADSTSNERLADLMSVNDVHGGAVDVGAYLSDDPECFYTVAEEDRTTPIVRISVDPSASGSISADIMFNKGHAVLALVNALEAQGNSVELSITSSNCMRDAGIVTRVIVKHAGEPWSAANVAFAIAHPAFARRLAFAVAERCKTYGAIVSTHGGYGHPKYDTTHVDNIASDIHFGALSSREGRDYSTPKKALKFVMSAAKEQGILAPK